MPRNIPYLHLRPERTKPDGKLKEAARWVIIDGQNETSTGCGASDRERATLVLADYLARKHADGANQGCRSAAETPVADVIALYARDKVQSQARPKEVQARLNELLDFFGDMVLTDVIGDTCREFAGGSPSRRRALEDLRSAINYHREEGKCLEIVSVVLPPRYLPRERWLTRTEASQLIRYCWRQPRLKHVAKFILLSLYTGTRAGAVASAALRPTIHRGWVDLSHGVFYRRAPRVIQTKKRQPAIRLPRRLLCHLQIWSRTQKYVVEYQRKPVKRISKAFRSACDALGMEDVVIHSLRHTAITWAMQRGMPIWDASGYFGVSPQVLIDVYGHHHPEIQDVAHKVFDRAGKSGGKSGGK